MNTKLFFSLSLACFILAISSVYANAKIINASSCSQSNVQTAINTASTGDIVAIPSGNCTWTTDVTISNKGITLQGGGKANTVITNGGGILSITPSSTDNITIKDIGWLASNSSKNQTIKIVGDLSDKPVIITGCNFDGAWQNGSWLLGTAIFINGNYSLIHHNTFGEGAKETIHVGGGTILLWSADSDAGTANAVYIENNVFLNEEPSSVSAHHVVMGFGAARYVVRYNEIHNANIDAHGWCGSADGGTRWYEIYENKIYIDNGFNNTNIINLRGGTGAVFNNTITINGSLNWGIQLTEYRVDETYCKNIGGNPPCCCNTGGNNGEGYPCYDQIGRGKNQTSEPLYIWDNTFSGKGVNIKEIGVRDLSGDCDAICGTEQLMSDYIQDETGHGDYYDDGTSLPGYTPFPYPHPLASGVVIPPTTISTPSDFRTIIK